MNSNPIVITPHVLNTLRALPDNEKHNIAAALADEMLLGTECNGLEPIEDMIYSILRFYIRRDSSRYAKD
ncbi:MAG: hypothetical protein NC405_02605 [Odoribacter sp.]|nr:hypothetical protein [Odoribacter sp.]